MLIVSRDEYLSYIKQFSNIEIEMVTICEPPFHEYLVNGILIGRITFNETYGKPNQYEIVDESNKLPTNNS